jgi:anti-sigma28 factor (negative regulator of flagellin synthesis)
MKLHHQPRVSSTDQKASSEVSDLDERRSAVAPEEDHHDEERPPTDPQTLEEISSAVENGTYHPDLEDLADRLIDSPELSDLVLYST